MKKPEKFNPKNCSKYQTRHAILSAWVLSKQASYAYVFKCNGRMNCILVEDLITENNVDLLESIFDSEMWVMFLENYPNKTKLHAAVTTVFARIEKKSEESISREDRLNGRLYGIDLYE